MSYAPTTTSVRHLSVTVILCSAAALYLGLVVTPFFAYGLHQEPVVAVSEGHFQPSGFPLFDQSNGSGLVLRLLAICAIFAAPIMVLAVTHYFTRMMLYRWPTLNLMQRVTLVGVVTVSIALILFMVSPTGQLIAVWHLV
jgi:hypothetical protein